MQQEDPLGPLLFCLAIPQLQCQLNSELQMFYLDDGILRSSVEDRRHNLQVVERVGAEFGLQVKEQKTEIAAPTRIPPAFFAGGMHSGPQKATLLGSPNDKGLPPLLTVVS